LALLLLLLLPWVDGEAVAKIVDVLVEDETAPSVVDEGSNDAVALDDVPALDEEDELLGMFVLAEDIELGGCVVVDTNVLDDVVGVSWLVVGAGV